ncbi:MFS transporter, partial [Spirochaetota bacterium]
MAKKFAGMEVPDGLSTINFTFMFVCTLFAGMLMVIPTILQPPFMKDIIMVDQQYAGSVNSFLQNLSQISTLVLVAYVCSLSDRKGRKILAFIGFIICAVFYYLFGQSGNIAAALNISPGFSSKFCAFLSIVPGKSAEFTQFAPALFVAYVNRLILGIGLVFIYPQFITMVADYTYEKDRGKGMGFNGFMMGLGSLLV